MTPIDLANAPLVKAGIAGQVHVGVFHVDELAQVEFKTKKQWHLIHVPDLAQERPALRTVLRQQEVP